MAFLTAAGKACVVDTPQGQGAGGTDYYEPYVQHMWMPPYSAPMRNDLLLQKIQDEGNDVWFGYELVRLVHDDGAVTGGIFKCEDGYVKVSAPYVVLACGGYPANPEMMEAAQSDQIEGVSGTTVTSKAIEQAVRAALKQAAAK